jgi:hypothetical protein
MLVEFLFIFHKEKALKMKIKLTQKFERPYNQLPNLTVHQFHFHPPTTECHRLCCAATVFPPNEWNAEVVWLCHFCCCVVSMFWIKVAFDDDSTAHWKFIKNLLISVRFISFFFK